ncbi:hypothetical protein B9Z65_9032 [Elsinoe australis]|uniref:Uncharacterized protein n=1 Tax=Elsinoe australis TaxID=40998 RepID=A0A2P8ABI4_9PEZI|nr:hypothetical protein B9Z65_9032 [Elsinoe australis]
MGSGPRPVLFLTSPEYGQANVVLATAQQLARAGVSHLVLPIWWDTYEYAERAKYHRIGAIGNAGVAPAVDADQFGSELLLVLGDKEIKRNAAAIGAACKRRGEGREIAAAEVASWAQAFESWPEKGGPWKSKLSKQRDGVNGDLAWLQ